MVVQFILNCIDIRCTIPLLGVSAREMLDAIAGGEEDPEKLANFARGTEHCIGVQHHEKARNVLALL
jgi:hypothetical protein